MATPPPAKRFSMVRFSLLLCAGAVRVFPNLA